MNRRDFFGGMLALVAASAAAWVFAGQRRDPAIAQGKGSGSLDGKAIQSLRKSREEWRQVLGRDAYDILFRDQTEPPFSSPLNDEYRDGLYLCAACFVPLFSSETKFDSGTGWPSFYAPIEGRVGTKADYKLIIPRTEYHCIRCGGHQGHVFDDGPPPTGQRWCNNGLALRFVPAGEPLPELRG